jgi:predicted N-acyltransferase
MKELNFQGPYTLKLARSITEFSPAQWNSLVTGETLPFLEWEWLEALETSGSAAPESGWHPLHLSLWKSGRLLAAAPLYLKYHSDGEFVWDYFWAEAAASLGRPWYPKLVGTVPATPAEGYRFLFDRDEDPVPLNRALLDAAEGLCRNNGIRGLHLLFTDPLWASRPGSLAERRYSPWKHSRFAWENAVPGTGGKAGGRGFADFGEYLACFNKNQRKNIRKEYRRHEEQGIGLRIVQGNDAGIEYFDKIFRLYSLTNDKFMPWDARWVNEAFFRRIAESFRRRTVFSEAFWEDPPPAGHTPGAADTSGGVAAADKTLALAMMFRKGGKLWGRYWGTVQDVKDLHFAVCYYAPMEYCIREGIAYFDPGIGSPHKIRRGFRAGFDVSYHLFFDPILERLFRTNIAAVNRYEEDNIAALNAELPFQSR